MEGLRMASMEGKNLAVVGTVLTEITNVVLAKCNTGTLGKDYQLKSPIEIIRMVNDVLPKGYEKIDVRRMDYEKHLKAMISMMDRIVEMPDSKTARRWLRLKRTMLRDKCARKEGEKGDVWTRRKLRYLRREAKRNDAKMLAKAMWLSDKRKVYFVSNDGDHLIFDEWAENRTGGRIEICRPSVLP